MQNLLDLTQNLDGDSRSLINNSVSNEIEIYNYNNNSDDNKDSRIYRNCKNNDSFKRPSSPSDSGCSKSIGCGSDSNFETEQDFIKNSFFGLCFCDKCNILCSVDFMDNLDLKFACGCTYIEGINIKEFQNDYLKQIKEQSKDFKIFCPYHKAETEFLKYFQNV